MAEYDQVWLRLARGIVFRSDVDRRLLKNETGSENLHQPIHQNCHGHDVRLVLADLIDQLSFDQFQPLALEQTTPGKLGGI